MNTQDHGLILVTYWTSAFTLLIVLEVHVVWPLLKAGARFREKILASIREDQNP